MAKVTPLWKHTDTAVAEETASTTIIYMSVWKSEVHNQKTTWDYTWYLKLLTPVVRNGNTNYRASIKVIFYWEVYHFLSHLLGFGLKVFSISNKSDLLKCYILIYN